MSKETVKETPAKEFNKEKQAIVNILEIIIAK